MKKVLFSVAIVMCVFALTGCGGANKTLNHYLHSGLILSVIFILSFIKISIFQSNSG